MRVILALIAALFLAGCASEDEDYSSQQGSPSVRLAKPAGEPGMAVKQTF
jgi:PBP1b-binding outer membrane lipoprotein LpoB